MWGIPMKPMGTLLRSCVRATCSSQITLGGLVDKGEDFSRSQAVTYT